ncbi:MAG: alpha-glucan family phosphorylase, partial [Gemmataceae bacterium]
GKELIAEIMQFARKPEFRRRMVFLEDYDINVCRYLVQGVDVWLNNPRRPLEASGTSGMKVAANGGLNLSILDGWWCEGYAGDNGFAIGAGEEYTDTAYQDQVEGRAALDMLEQEIVPLFYTRGNDDVPRGWVRMMKRAIVSLAPVFSTGRMVAEYATRIYLPNAERWGRLMANDLERAEKLANWRLGIRHGWAAVKVREVRVEGAEPRQVGDLLRVQAVVELGNLTPKDVLVELFYGTVDNEGDIPHPHTAVMNLHGGSSGAYTYQVAVECKASGQQGYGVRVLPQHEDLPHPHEPGLICWG